MAIGGLRSAGAAGMAAFPLLTYPRGSRPAAAV